MLLSRPGRNCQCKEFSHGQQGDIGPFSLCLYTGQFVERIANTSPKQSEEPWWNAGDSDSWGPNPWPGNSELYTSDFGSIGAEKIRKGLRGRDAEANPRGWSSPYD
jgi:hypothetical protein